MRPLLAMTAALALATATAWPQQDMVRLHTNPKPPGRDVLDRLSMTLAWSFRVKTENQRDGLLSVQLLPDPDKRQLIVQTFRGAVVALDADTGDFQWQTHVGIPYHIARPVGYNSQSIFTTRREKLFVLDRDTGKQMLWTVDKDSGLREFGTSIESVPTAGLAADDEMVYICMESRVSAYTAPDFRTLFKLRAKEETEAALKRMPSPQMHREWTRLFAVEEFTQAPMLARSTVGLVATNGTFLTLTKLEGLERFRYQAEKAVSAPAAQTGDVVYVASHDLQLYAFDMFRSRRVWRFAASAPTTLPVQATGRDVFVAPDRMGMYCVERASGAERWRAKNAERFLATNGKFVYAFDQFKNLLVLDGERGTQLSKLDTRDFTVPVPNEWTDRLYLAAHNGLIVCLHHRNYLKPLKIKTPPSEVPVKGPPKKDGKKDEKKDDEKKDDEKKDDEKKDDKKKDDKKDDEVGMGRLPRAALTALRVDFNLECGEHRRFGCFLDWPVPGPRERKSKPSKAAMLAALQVETRPLKGWL